MILPLGKPPPKAMSNVSAPLGTVSLSPRTSGKAQREVAAPSSTWVQWADSKLNGEVAKGSRGAWQHTLWWMCRQVS